MTTPEHSSDVRTHRIWAETYTQLLAVDAAEPLAAQQLEELAVAAHCIGEADASTAAWGRAYTDHLASGDVESAARAAGWCSFGLLTRGESALGGGWLARAQALCDEHELDGPARWFVAGQWAAAAMLGGDYAAAIVQFEQTQRQADRLRDPDGMTLCRLGRGQCLIQLGRAQEGLQLLDEVMVAVSTDAVSPLVSGLAYCAAIESCQQVFEVRRAQQWTAALTRWCDEHPDLVPYRGTCLVHRAEILTLHGAWPEAHREAERARQWLGDGPAAGNAAYRLAEVHRLRGQYAEAEAGYQRASMHGRDTQPGLALLRLAQGHLESATAALRRALDETTDLVGRAHLLGPCVEVALAAAQVPAAREAADELSGIAAQLDVPLLQAESRSAEGAVMLAEGAVQQALGCLRSAWTSWQELEAPYHGARVRVLIGEACRALGDDDTAEMELDAAGWVFTELGAAPDLARVQRLSMRRAAAAPGGLSRREAQVLRLVAAGMSNRAIADDLFLSEKTVHRHVSNIFAKLGVGSRSAATAYAFQHDLV
ncbi:MAG: helix-turn-helix transcriptional regulator [Actinomycetota bacterium]|nr:MAG: helix-turn-helix transcriptional regulator [Actinomycetota bacterium]